MNRLDERYVRLARLLESRFSATQVRKALSLLEAEETIQVTLGGDKQNIPAEYTWMAVSVGDEVHFFTGEPKYARGKWQGPGKLLVATLDTDYLTLGEEVTGIEFDDNFRNFDHYMKAIYKDVLDYFSDAVVKIRPGINLDDYLPDYTDDIGLEYEF